MNFIIKVPKSSPSFVNFYCYYHVGCVDTHPSLKTGKENNQGQNEARNEVIIRMHGTSLVGQWLRLYAPRAGGPGFNPWSGN